MQLSLMFLVINLSLYGQDIFWGRRKGKWVCMYLLGLTLICLAGFHHLWKKLHFTLKLFHCGMISDDHAVDFHSCTKDTQVHLSLEPECSESLSHLQNCFREIQTWMTSKLVKNNSGRKVQCRFLAVETWAMFSCSRFLSEGSHTHFTSKFLAEVILYFQLSSDKHIENAVKQLFIISKFKLKFNPAALMKSRKLLVHFHYIQTWLQNSLSFFKTLTASFL